METPRIDFGEIFSEVVQGNKDALEFLNTFLHWVHLIDDVIDGSKPNGNDEYVLRVNLEVLATLSFNPFWQQHKHSLFPVVLQASRAYADSNRWAKRVDFRDRATSDVLKSQYQDVWFHVAYLIGGYQHMCKISDQFRIYDYDSQG